MLRKLKPILKYAIPLIIVAFMARAIYQNWQQIQDYPWKFNPLYLAIAFVLSSSWFWFRTALWRSFLVKLKYKLPYLQAFRVFMIAEVARYVPGKIWQYVSRIYLADRYGIPAATTLTSAMVELMIMMIAAGTIAAANFTAILPNVSEEYRYLALGAVLIAIVLVHPKAMLLWSRILAKMLKQDWSPFEIKYLALLEFWLTGVVIWLVSGSGFGFFVLSVVDLPLSTVPSLMSMFAAAWLISLLAIVVPAGFGVREGVLVLMLSTLMPSATAVVIAFASRLWVTLLEVIFLALARIFISGPTAKEEQDLASREEKLEAPSAS
jgi:hypothetical protein